LPKLSLIDSHCHLIFENFSDDLDKVCSRWRKVGVNYLVHACVKPSEIISIKKLADRFPELRYAVGVHPLDTDCWNDETLNHLRNAAQGDERIVAIGEIGIDLFREDNLQEQLDILRPQLELAVELDLPVIIHCRDAAGPMLKELTSFVNSGTSIKGVMHCWSGTPEEMSCFLDIGFFVSFSGNVTFPKAHSVHNCAKAVPSDRFLIETDCPFLSPVPNRGKRNEPSYVEFVAAQIANLRGQLIEDVARDSTRNAKNLFKLI
tara:strand:+ start:228 stop:1013 length:786 start_codon:yes stop_codon:yes gene_type:complete